MRQIYQYSKNGDMQQAWPSWSQQEQSLISEISRLGKQVMALSSCKALPKAKSTCGGVHSFPLSSE
jgi:hypothetical protein